MHGQATGLLAHHYNVSTIASGTKYPITSEPLSKMGEWRDCRKLSNAGTPGSMRHRIVRQHLSWRVSGCSVHCQRSEGQQ